MAQALQVVDGAGGGESGGDRLVRLGRAGGGREAAACESLRVVIADGQGLVRAGLRVLLERQADLRVVGEAADVEQAAAVALEWRPDVVVIDFELPGGGGLAATRRIVADAAPGATRVVILVADERERAVVEALRAGATGLLRRDGDADELVRAVRAAAAGEALLAPRLARVLVAEMLARPERLDASPERLEELTAREREVVALVAYGLSNEEIAERLVVTRATAKTHVSRALCKLRARDRAQLVVLAYETGLVRPGPHGHAAPARVAPPAPVARIARSPAVTARRRDDLRPLAA